MLTKYNITNFKSFKNNTHIDLISTNYKILSKTNVTENNILKGLMFVGANASGKTNVILAIKVLLDLLFRDKLVDLKNYYSFFADDPNIILDFEFNINNKLINYYIEYDIQKKIIIEKLYLEKEVILDRIGKNAKTTITENNKYDDLDNEVLLLRDIYFNTKFRGNEVLKQWFSFLSNSAYINPYTRKIVSTGKSPLDLNEYIEQNGVEIINNFFSDYGFNQRIEYAEKAKGNNININTDGEKSIFFKRKGVEEPIPFPMESLGNQNLLHILPAFFHVVENGGILLIDEFSSGFHNELEELLINYFMEKSELAQIIFVSHSTNLLSNTLLRPDQVYSINFNGSAGSVIKRFSSEKPREAQNIEKMYKSGVFNGLPNYKNK